MLYSWNYCDINATLVADKFSYTRCKFHAAMRKTAAKFPSNIDNFKSDLSKSDNIFLSKSPRLLYLESNNSPEESVHFTE
jgi:hypothetical protein